MYLELAASSIPCALVAGLLCASPRSAVHDGSRIHDILLQANALATSTMEGISMGADPCDRTASMLALAGIKGIEEDLATEVAKCLNFEDLEEGEDCVEDAYDGYAEALKEQVAIHAARLETCALLGGGVYDPQINLADFDNPQSNPYFPLVPGTTMTYEKMEDGEFEVVVVTVSDDTINILGIDCIVVCDTATVDGVLLEQTFDWYAQDNAGNVWYFGEISFNYEDGEISDIAGSWKSGVEGAKPGILMFANPVPGTTYRQEFAIDDAEDMGTVVSLRQSATVPAGTYVDCVQTEDFTPLEPGNTEFKYYAPGVGLVLEVDPDSGARLELVSISM